MSTNSSSVSGRKRDFILRLFELGAVKCESITLKTGEATPLYFNLRLLISDPELLQEASLEMMRTAEEFIKETDEPLPKIVCGVPYAALSLATCMAMNWKQPMVMCRKEKKDYGMKQLIEGKFSCGDECLIVEDVCTYGTSLGEISQLCRQEGLVVKKGVVLIDREQEAIRNLRENYDIHVKCVFSLSDILQVLVQEGKITMQIADEMHLFVRKNRFDNQGVKENPSLLPPRYGEFTPCLAMADRLERLSESKRPCRVLLLEKCPSAEEIARLKTKLSRDDVLWITRELLLNILLENTPFVDFDKLAKLVSIVVLDAQFCMKSGREAKQIMEKFAKQGLQGDIVTLSGLGASQMLEEYRLLMNTSPEEERFKSTFMLCVEGDPSRIHDASVLDLNSYRVDCKKICEHNQDLISAIQTTTPFNGTVQSLKTNTTLPYWIKASEVRQMNHANAGQEELVMKNFALFPCIVEDKRVKIVDLI